ncbi:uncharacterized protein RHO17_012013 [Thomomys bottae]
METGPAGAEGVRRRAVASGAGAEDEPEGVGETEPEEGRARGGARLDWAPRRPPEPRHVTAARPAPLTPETARPQCGRQVSARRRRPRGCSRPGIPGRREAVGRGGAPAAPRAASTFEARAGPRAAPRSPRGHAGVRLRRVPPGPRRRGLRGRPPQPAGEGAGTFVCPQWVASERETMKEARPLQSFLPSREKDSGWEQSALTALAQRGRKPIVMRPKDPGLETSGTTSQKHLGFEALQFCRKSSKKQKFRDDNPRPLGVG